MMFKQIPLRNELAKACGKGSAKYTEVMEEVSLINIKD